MLNAENAQVQVRGCAMHYIRFGTAPRTLVMIPGVGDGFQTVKGMALPFSMLYWKLAREFTVYVFSRREVLAPHTTTREMAEDLSEAMELLSLEHACVVGVSQGGMITQWLAVDHPERVERLVLTVSACRPNATMRTVIGHWMELADAGDYLGILLDTAERSYTPKRLKRALPTYKVLARTSRPKSYDRFLIQAESCLTHDARAQLGRIACPTLVIGGTEDGIVTAEASRELAEEIPGAQLYLYEGLSHGLYEEAPDFMDRVTAFFR